MQVWSVDSGRVDIDRAADIGVGRQVKVKI
jgi:hypothetical protein